jgi:hypothetical protein
MAIAPRDASYGGANTTEDGSHHDQQRRISIKVANVTVPSDGCIQFLIKLILA